MNITKVVAEVLYKELTKEQQKERNRTRRPLYKRILAEIKDIISYSWIPNTANRFYFLVHRYGFGEDAYLYVNYLDNAIYVLKPGEEIKYLDDDWDGLHPPLSRFYPTREQREVLVDNLRELSDNEVFKIVVKYFEDYNKRI